MGSHNRSADSQIVSTHVKPLSSTIHDRMREQLAKDVDAFLAHGGQIKHLESHLRSNLSDADTESDSY